MRRGISTARATPSEVEGKAANATTAPRFRNEAKSRGADQVGIRLCAVDREARCTLSRLATGWCVSRQRLVHGVGVQSPLPENV